MRRSTRSACHGPCPMNDVPANSCGDSGSTARSGVVAAALLAALALVACVAIPAIARANAADPAFWYSTAPDGSPRIRLHFFWTKTCPHCQAAKPFMEALPSRLPYVELVSHPTDGDAGNARLQYATASALGADPVSVPAIFFCGESQIGYDDASTTGTALVQRLEQCRARLAADSALLTKPVPVLATSARANSGAGSYVAIAIGVAFLALVAAGVVLSRRAAAAKARDEAARREQRGEAKRRRRR